MTTGMHPGHLNDNSTQTMARIDKEEIERLSKILPDQMMEGSWMLQGSWIFKFS